MRILRDIFLILITIVFLGILIYAFVEGIPIIALMVGPYFLVFLGIIIFRYLNGELFK